MTRRSARAPRPFLHLALPAVRTQRAAHRLHRRGRGVTAAWLVLVQAVTGTEIHPGTELGRWVFIDHGSAWSSARPHGWVTT